MTMRDFADAVPFSKGHGTENDFIILRDTDVRLDLTVGRTAALCDRQRGLGADGVLRVARAGDLAEKRVLSQLPAGVAPDDWFMDYRNADGSIAEMCGNGVRVFAHYLRTSGLETRTEFTVGSRAGARPVIVHQAGAYLGEVTVEMGPVTSLGQTEATLSGRTFTGLGIDVGNPHLACVDDTLTTESLEQLDISDPVFDKSFFPRGVNIEILTALRNGVVEMRVNERGVGETRSCGTGTVAAAAAALAAAGESTGSVVVRIPGGEVTVTITAVSSFLRGPSVLVATGEIAGQWWDAMGIAEKKEVGAVAAQAT
ncbi:diaminopimelate epimerase [Hoyosella altamirensis]|uniref:Diaminopimelate epimerase n=1 Tax=Hoyosella altamirensis TaxID=616997 RepID=A0A839RNW3_9ACTN|nr:diaminopimelate epimerase [Hoyosella altamirensis]MBB3038475.1 diaminopimelate epimerase [Hoyosella altamirensis]